MIVQTCTYCRQAGLPGGQQVLVEGGPVVYDLDGRAYHPECLGVVEAILEARLLHVLAEQSLEGGVYARL